MRLLEAELKLCQSDFASSFESRSTAGLSNRWPMGQLQPVEAMPTLAQQKKKTS